MKRKDSREINPWVLVNKTDYSIIQEGIFFELVGKSGHLMTKEYYHQFIDEIK
jgi:hypothetical protein